MHARNHTRPIYSLFPIAVLVALGVVSGGCEKKDESKPAQQASGSPQSKSSAQPNLNNLPDAPEPEMKPVTRFQAGRLLEAKKDYFSAAIEYEKAISLNRDFTVAYLRLATCYIRLDRLNVAEQVLRMGVQRQPKMASLHNNLGFVLLLERRYPEAEAEFREALAIQPKFVRAQVNLGLTLGYLGRFDQAFDTFKAVLPEADAHFNLGQVHELLGQREPAIQSYKAALALAPDMPDAQTALERLTAQGEGGTPVIRPSSPGISFTNPASRPETGGGLSPDTQPAARADFVGPPIPSREVTPNPVVSAPTKAPGERVASAPSPTPLPSATPVRQVTSRPTPTPLKEVQEERKTPAPVVVGREGLAPASQPAPPPATQPVSTELTQAPASQPQAVVAIPTPTPPGMGYPVVDVTAKVQAVKETEHFPAQP